MNSKLNLMLAAALAASLTVPVAALAQGKQGAAKADKAVAKVDRKKLKPVRVDAPPRPQVKTNVAPGTWHFPRHKGNSPKFRLDREKDWVDPTGGKPPVKVSE